MTERHEPRIVVEASARRRRSAQGRVRDGRVVVRVPAGLGRRAQEDLVERVLARLRARAADESVPGGPPATVAARPTREPRAARGAPLLVARADAVADRWLDGIRAEHVTWSHRMTTRWASCTPAVGRIRVSHRLAVAPDHVLDDVLLHELAHLLQRGHGPAFRALTARNPQAAAAQAWLEQHQRHELRVALGVESA